MTTQTLISLPSRRRRFVIDRDGECRYINVEFTPRSPVESHSAYPRLMEDLQTLQKTHTKKVREHHLWEDAWAKHHRNGDAVNATIAKGKMKTTSAQFAEIVRQIDELLTSPNNPAKKLR